MAEDLVLLDPGAERFHDHDPDDPTWNESWLVSWLPGDGRMAGLFRVGTLPNQGRAWLWLWLWTGEGWVTIEETRLAYDDLDRGNGVAYDRWGLHFAYQPTAPLERGRFTIKGIGLVRSGRREGDLVPVSVDLDLEARTPCYTTGAGHDDRATAFAANRFEQSMAADGTAVVAGEETPLACPAHRDRSWGPRTWQFPYMLGDLQSADRQIYFAGGPNAEGGVGKGYVREGSDVATLTSIGAEMDYDDPAATIGPSKLWFRDERGREYAYAIEPIAPSVQFDMAHASEPPRHFLYWRTLVRATPVDGGEPVVGWFEANRFPYPEPSV
jgi:hypothetical protein